MFIKINYGQILNWYKFNNFFREFGSKSRPPKLPLNKIYKLKNAPAEELPEVEQLEIVDEPEESKPDDQEPQPNAESEEEITTEKMDELVTRI